jgi:hypothetical protein
LDDRSGRERSLPAGGDPFQQGNPFGGQQPARIPRLEAGITEQRADERPPLEIDFVVASHPLAKSHSGLSFNRRLRRTAIGALTHLNPAPDSDQS